MRRVLAALLGSRRRDSGPRIGLLAAKISDSDLVRLSNLFPCSAELARPEGDYDAIISFNVCRDAISIARARASTLLVFVVMEPPHLWPDNYDDHLLSEADLVLTYSADPGGSKVNKQHFRFFAASAREIVAQRYLSVKSERDIDHVIFARHDPNYRTRIGRVLCSRNGRSVGPLYGEVVPEKGKIQRRARYEWITENCVDDHYMSEKVAQSLMAGCVPVYFGCSNWSSVVDARLVYPLSERDLASNESINEVADYLERDEVYAKFYEAGLAIATDFLLTAYSFEACVVKPMLKLFVVRGVL